MTRNWFITGSSRGLGAALVRHALRSGDSVTATARDPEAVRAAFGAEERLLACRLDVTDQESVSAAVDRAVAEFGRIDVLVNNAGRGLVGAVEECTAGEVSELFDTNVFGPLSVIRCALPVLREQRAGCIVNVSSVCGVAGAPGWGVYSASKFAVEGYSDALAEELAPFGVHVVVVQPGAFRTDFLDPSSLAQPAERIADYDRTKVGVARAWSTAANHRQAGDPDQAAAAIRAAVTAEQPPRRLPLGDDAIRAVETRNHLVTDELDTWRSVAAGMAHERRS